MKRRRRYDEDEGPDALGCFLELIPAMFITFFLIVPVAIAICGVGLRVAQEIYEPRKLVVVNHKWEATKALEKISYARRTGPAYPEDAIEIEQKKNKYQFTVKEWVVVDSAVKEGSKDEPIVYVSSEIIRGNTKTIIDENCRIREVPPKYFLTVTDGNREYRVNVSEKQWNSIEVDQTLDGEVNLAGQARLKGK